MIVAVFVNYHLEGQQERSESYCTMMLVNKLEDIYMKYSLKNLQLS